MNINIDDLLEEEEITQEYHPHMGVDLSDAIEYTTLKNKITAIIPTSTAPMECFMWTIFSFLLTVKPNDLLEHFCVCINGPDKRTGDPSLQDKKQAFLEELRLMKWYHQDRPNLKKDMPLTVIRAWSRIGHPEAVEMALPWVHTDAYLISHDDIIITKDNWLDEVKNTFYADDDIAITFSQPLLCALFDSAVFKDKHLLRFPHLLCTFLICRKKWLESVCSSWCGYHIEMPDFTINELTDNHGKEFIDHFKPMTNHDAVPTPDRVYNYISMEMGAWHFHNINEHKLKYSGIDPSLIVHFGAMSWDSPESKNRRLGSKIAWVKNLEEKIQKHPEYYRLYQKYLTQ